MKTIETLNTMIKADRLGSIAARKAIRANVETVENIYAESISGTPAETVKKIVSAIGYESAVEIIASMVNRISAWDGRISRTAKEWASTQGNAWDEEAADRIGIYSDRIHAAHLNQIAEAMANCR